MKRFLLSLALVAIFLVPAFAADVSHHGFVVSCNDSTQEVTIAPAGWHPPMQLPPPRLCDTDTYTQVRWLWLNESPAPEIWLIDSDTSDGVFDAWSYY